MKTDKPTPQPSGERVIDALYRVILERRRHSPEDSYVASLFARGSDRIIQKVGEEACEVVIAAKNRESSALVAEIADLVFHLLVLLADQGLEPAAIRNELVLRFGTSGLRAGAGGGAGAPGRRTDLERPE